MTKVDRATRIFFDASCLIAAASSPTGGAGLIWSFCAQKRMVAAVSAEVIVEARRNLARKFSDSVCARFESMIADMSLLITSVPREDIVPEWYDGINAKDEHVVAAAIATGSHFLLTLDRPLIREVRVSGASIVAFRPEEFLVEHVPSHPEYPFQDDTSELARS